MTTIILTIIGILLAASAALMVIFYGGDAFNSGSTGASANTIMNAGTNVLSAIGMFKSEKAAVPTSIADLKTSGVGGPYLKDDPVIPNGTTQALNGAQYSVSTVDDASCQRINTNLRLSGITSASATTSQKMLCVPSATAGSPGVFYANS